MAQGGTDLVAVKERSVYTLAHQHNDWTQHPDNPYPEDVEDICFCSVPGGLFGMGGRKNGYVIKQCHYFNGTIWERKPDMINARHSASAAVLENEILVVGGERETSRVNPEEKNKGGERDITVNAEERNKGEKFNFVGDPVSDWQPLPSLVKPLWEQQQELNAPLLHDPMLKPLVASAAGILFVVPRECSISGKTCMQQFTPGLPETDFVKVRLPSLVENQDDPELVAPNLLETDHASRATTSYNCLLRESNCACLVGFADLLYLMGGIERMTFQYNPGTEQWTNLCPTRPPCTWPEYYKGCSAIGIIGGKILVCGVPMGQEESRVVDGFDIETREWKLNYENISVPFTFDWKNSYWGSM